MKQLKPELVNRLRSLAHEGEPVPQMLRMLVRELGPALSHELTLAQYIREAFGLTLSQAKPIGGWYPNGEGELTDTQLNDILMPAIENNRQEWDRLVTN